MIYRLRLFVLFLILVVAAAACQEPAATTTFESNQDITGSDLLPFAEGSVAASIEVAEIVDPTIVAGAAAALPDGAVLAGVFDISSETTLVAEQILVFPISASTAPGVSLPVGGVVYFDETSGSWEYEAADWDADRQAFIVETAHLSWWAPWTWDWDQIKGEISASLGRLTGSRASPPSCEGETPPWVNNVIYVDYPTNPILACAESDPANPNIAVVRITNNRTYSMVLIPTAQFAWAHVDLPHSILEVAKAAATDELLAPDAVLMPPLAEAVMGIHRPEVSPFRIDAKVAGASLILDVSLIALEQIGVDDWETISLLASCAGDGLLALGGIDVSIDYIGRIFGLVGSCLGNRDFLAELAQSGVTIADLEKLSGIGKLFEVSDVAQLGLDFWVDEMVLFGDDFVSLFASSPPVEQTPSFVAEGLTPAELFARAGLPSDVCGVDNTYGWFIYPQAGEAVEMTWGVGTSMTMRSGTPADAASACTTATFDFAPHASQRAVFDALIASLRGSDRSQAVPLFWVSASIDDLDATFGSDLFVPDVPCGGLGPTVCTFADDTNRQIWEITIRQSNPNLGVEYGGMWLIDHVTWIHYEG